MSANVCYDTAMRSDNMVKWLKHILFVISVSRCLSKNAYLQSMPESGPVLGSISRLLRVDYP